MVRELIPKSERPTCPIKNIWDWLKRPSPNNFPSSKKKPERLKGYRLTKKKSPYTYRQVRFLDKWCLFEICTCRYTQWYWNQNAPISRLADSRYRATTYFFRYSISCRKIEARGITLHEQYPWPSRSLDNTLNTPYSGIVLSSSVAVGSQSARCCKGPVRARYRQPVRSYMDQISAGELSARKCLTRVPS